MIGLFRENGPCHVNPDGATTVLNPFRYLLKHLQSLAPHSCILKSAGTILATVRLPLPQIESLNSALILDGSDLHRPTYWHRVLFR